MRKTLPNVFIFLILLVSMLISTRINAQITGPGGSTSSAICVNEVITVTENHTPLTGLWTSSDPTIATVNSTGIVTGVKQGSCNIYYTPGLLAQDVYPIVVSAPPAPPAAISGLTSVCSGGTITLTDATAGGTWSSDKPSYATVAPDIHNNGVVTGVASGVTNIIYTVNSACGSSSSFITVAVNNIPEITGTTAVCQGSTTTLYNAAAGGVWSNDNSGHATIDPATGIVTAISTGSTVIKYSLTNSCGTNFVSTTVTVGTPITNAGTITGISAICAGTTTPVFTETVAGGVWSSDNSSVASVNSSGAVTAIQGGKANILYTLTNGCGSLAATFPVTVNPVLTAAPAGINGPNTVCGNNSQILLTDFIPGGTWSSANLTAATIDPSTGVVTGLAAGTSIIKYTLSNGVCGVPASASFNLTVTNCTCSTLPTASAITGTASVTAGLTTQLSSTATNGTGAWSSANTSIASVSSSGLVTGSSAGIVNIFYTVTSSCGASVMAVQSVTVNAAAIPPPHDPCNGLAIAPTVNTAIQCITGNNFVFNDHTTGGTPFSAVPLYLYNWNFGDGATANVGACSHSYSKPGDYNVSLIVTDVNGCQTASQLQITVGTTVTAGYNVNFLTGNGNGTTFTSTSSTNAGNLTYNWDFGTVPVTTSTSGNPTVYFQPGTYTVTLTVTGSGGCTDNIAQKVNVTNSTVSPVADLLPSAPASGFISVNPNHICLNVAVPVLMGNPTDLTTLGGSFPWTGSWSSLNTNVADIVASGVNAGTITPHAAGDATIVYTVTNGHQTVKTSVVITVLGTLGSPFINGIASICNGSSALFTSNISGGTWSNDPASTHATVDSKGNVTGNSLGTSVISYNAGNVCSSATSYFTVTVKQCCPPLILDPTTGPTSVIAGGAPITLSNTTSKTIKDGGTGIWASDNINIATIASFTAGTSSAAATCSVSGVAVGAANITYTYTNACGTILVTSYSVNVTAAAPLSPTCSLAANFTITGGAQQCITGNNFHFVDATTATGTAPYIYTWDFKDGPGSVITNSQLTIGGNDQNHTFSKAGAYDVSLVVTDASGCSSNYMVQVAVGPEPTASFQVEYNTGNNGKGITFLSTSSIPSGNLNYLWNFGDGTTSNASSATVYYATTGIYTVSLTVTGIGTCSANDVLDVSYGGISSTPVSACPNPAPPGSSNVNLSFTPVSSVNQVYALVLNSNGHFVKEVTLTPVAGSGVWNISLAISGLSTGTYFVKLLDQNHQLIGVSTIVVQ